MSRCFSFPPPRYEIVDGELRRKEDWTEMMDKEQLENDQKMKERDQCRDGGEAEEGKKKDSKRKEEKQCRDGGEAVKGNKKDHKRKEREQCRDGTKALVENKDQKMKEEEQYEDGEIAEEGKKDSSGISEEHGEPSQILSCDGGSNCSSDHTQDRSLKRKKIEPSTDHTQQIIRDVFGEESDQETMSESKALKARDQQSVSESDALKAGDEQVYRELTNWIPPQNVLPPEDLDWLLKKKEKSKPSLPAAKKIRPTMDGGLRREEGCRLTVQPRAVYLPEVDIFVLPYVLPF